MALRIGIVGAGEIARFHERHLRAAGALIVGAVSRRPRPDMRTYPALSALLPEVDAVTIAVPNFLHTRLCLEALGADKAVFVEKPLCIEPGELQNLQATLPRSARPVHVGFRLRWNPALRALKDRLRGTRRVSCIYQLGIERLAAGKPWTRRQEESGGALCTLAVHALDLARWLAGAGARPLTDLRGSSTARTAGADFPLVVHVEGTIQDGPRIAFGADLRGSIPFGLRLDIEADQGCYPDATLPSPLPEDPAAADVEYAGMMKRFAEAAGQGLVEPEAIAEMLQCHEDLLLARSVVEPAACTGRDEPP